MESNKKKKKIMNSNTPKISIIFPSYNGEKFLYRNLNSIKNLSNLDEIEVIIIDNNSTDSSIEIIQSFKSKIKLNLIRQEKNLGFAKACNIGVLNAKGKYIFITNQDVIFPSIYFLKKLVNSFQYLERFKKTDKIIVGPRICNYNGKIEYSRKKINFLGFSNMDISKSNKIRRTMISSGCAFLIKKKYYEELDGFEESYFMYHEDIDFSIRASLLGIKQYIDNTIHLYHLRSDKDFKLTRFKYYFHERNRLMMTLEHSKKKNKMFLAHLFFEPFHIVFALMNGLMKERLKVYKYIIQNFSRIMRNKKKENDIFDRYYEMEGIFNEVNLKSITFKLLDFFSKVLFYFYHHS